MQLPISNPSQWTISRGGNRGYTRSVWRRHRHHCRAHRLSPVRDKGYYENTTNGNKFEYLSFIVSCHGSCQQSWDISYSNLVSISTFSQSFMEDWFILALGNVQHAVVFERIVLDTVHKPDREPAAVEPNPGTRHLSYDAVMIYC